MGRGFEGGESRHLTHLQSHLAVYQIPEGVQAGGEPFVRLLLPQQKRALPLLTLGGLVGKYHPLKVKFSRKNMELLTESDGTALMACTSPLAP